MSRILLSRHAPLVALALLLAVVEAHAQRPSCDDSRIIACFVDVAQAKLRACVMAPPAPSNSAARRQECVAVARAEVERLYRLALANVRYQRGTTNAVKDYYDDWNKTIDLLSAVAASSDRVRDDFERLNVKAERLRQG